MRTQANPSRRVKGLVAGAAGAALLLAGGTWALWYDSDAVSGQTITAGNLDLGVVGRVHAYDVSTWTGVNTDDHQGTIPGAAAARQDAGINLDTTYPALAIAGSGFAGLVGHEIDVRTSPGVSTWHAVPGDKVAVVLPYVVALQGDNLVAELKVTPSDEGSVIDSYDVVKNLSLGIFLKTDGTWSKVKSLNDAAVRAAIADDAPWFEQLLQAANETNGTLEPGDIPVVTATRVPANPSAADTNLVIIVTGEFDPDTFDRDAATEALVKYTDLTVELEQTRDPDTGNF